MGSSAEGAPAEGACNCVSLGKNQSGELIDLEDPKQRKATKEQRTAFLAADISKVNSKYHAGANSANATADTTFKQATWSETHSTTDAKATFSALDANGDGDCRVLPLVP